MENTRLDSLTSVRKLGLSALVLAMLVIGVEVWHGQSGLAGAQDTTPGAMVDHPLVGAWIVDRNPARDAEPPTVYIFTADGTVVDPLVGAAGSWQATGPRSAGLTIAGYPDPEIGPGYFVIRATVEVDESGMTYSGTASITVLAPDGTVNGGFRAEPLGTRLSVEPVDAVESPLAGFPRWAPELPPDATPAS